MLQFKIILLTLVSSFILLNTLDKNVFQFMGLMPHEWVIIIFFIFVELKYRLVVTWVDKFFFTFFLLAIIIPLALNYDSSVYEIFGVLLPIKTWMTYRISLRIFRRALLHRNLIDLIHIALSIIIFISLIAAIIGLLRFINIPVVSDFINQMWPMQERFLDPKGGGRLASTMSGVNGSGIFFAIAVIISVYMHQTTRNYLYFLLSLLFIITIILTGSFTAIIILSIALILIYRRFLFSFFTPRMLVTSVIICFFIILVGSAFTSLNKFFFNVIEQRLERQIHSEISPYKFIPTSLYGRAIRWPDQLSILNERPFFGYGAIFSDQTISKFNLYLNPHNYYFYILMQGGIFGFLGYLLFKIYLLKKVINIQASKEKKMLLSILLVVLISQITSLTFQYGGISELFGIIMCLIYLLDKSDAKPLME